MQDTNDQQHMIAQEVQKLLKPQFNQIMDKLNVLETYITRTGSGFTGQNAGVESVQTFNEEGHHCSQITMNSDHPLYMAETPEKEDKLKRKNSNVTNPYSNSNKRVASGTQKPNVTAVTPAAMKTNGISNMHIREKCLSLKVDGVYCSMLPLNSATSLYYNSDEMKEFSNNMTGRSNQPALCNDCSMPYHTHGYQGNCPVKMIHCNPNSNVCTRCLLPGCKRGYNYCGYKHVLMIIAIVCSDSDVNKIVGLKWGQFCRGNSQLLGSFPKGENNTTVEGMTSTYNKLYSDEAFRNCFWNAVNAAGIFEAKFFADTSKEHYSNALSVMHGKLADPLQNMI